MNADTQLFLLPEQPENWSVRWICQKQIRRALS